MPKRSSSSDPIPTYLAEIQRNLASGIAREQTHRHALQDFLQALDPTVVAFNDPKHIEVGAPDFTIRRKGQDLGFPVGWLETKDIGDDLNRTEKSDQLKRYLGLPNLILTDYLEFRWYADGTRRMTARLAAVGRGGKLHRDREGEQEVLTLLSEFLRQSIASVATPKELAERMARLAHIIRDILLRTFEAESDSGKLHSQFQAFRETLIPDLKPDQFADMYAQTITYGLFAARCQPKTTRQSFSRASSADLIPRTNPFLRKLFQSIAFELDERVLPFVDDLVALLRDADIGSIMADFGKRATKEDPVVHFYEDFLREYDPKVREMRGVYYTPEPVFAEWIADEANAAAEIKRDKPIMVVLGNPPYAGHSANRSYIERIVEPGEAYQVVVGGPLAEQQSVQQRVAKKRMKIRERTFIGSLLQDYYFVDGKPLAEKNPKWLQDDYVKFIRFAQWRIVHTGYGILGFISNNAYLDNPTFRGMRQQLMNTFSDIRILDLHGSTKRLETSPDGSPDKNVFDIQQGVAILVATKPADGSSPTATSHADLWGRRGDETSGKYGWLFSNDIATTPWQEHTPQAPFYLFVPANVDLQSEYNKAWRLADVLPVNVLGFQTHRDHFAIDFDMNTVRERIAKFRDTTLPNEQLREMFELTDNRDWHLSDARKQLAGTKDWGSRLTLCLYRPFDVRPCYFSTVAMDYPRVELERHMLGPNRALVVGRQGQAVGSDQWDVLFCARHPVDANLYRRGGGTVFPLYCYPPVESDQRQIHEHDPHTPNLSSLFIAAASRAIGLKFLEDGKGDLNATFGPEDVFHYIYALLSCPAYRKRYSDFLKTDFPRVSLTSDKKSFAALAKKGAELASLHLMDSPKLNTFITKFPVSGSSVVEKVRYVDNHRRVYINKTQHFEDVPKEVWQFHIGGYQVCEKWLKDRKGRTLTSNDIDHYQKIVVALAETIRLMREIDDIIPGWPLH